VEQVDLFELNEAFASQARGVFENGHSTNVDSTNRVRASVCASP